MAREFHPTQQANILLVDDDPAVLRLLSHVLEHEGHRVRTATDGNMALQYTLQDCPEILITDWVMPGIDGLDLCRRIRQLYECRVLKYYTYIFLLTAQIGHQNLLEGLNAGADDFIEKSSDHVSDLKVEILVRLKTALRTRNMQRELEHAAKYDFATGLLNRSVFFDLGNELITKSMHFGQPLSAIMVDCDFFKRINDQYGHRAGDEALKALASVLQGHSRGYDMICRYGGEEFCALIPNCNEFIAFNWAERIRKQLETNSVVHDGKKITVTASFGVAERVEDVTTLDQLVERADQALLFAKESGRNRTVRYSEILADKRELQTSQMSSQLLFDDVRASEIMIPVVLTINENESVANVADFFLKTRVEALPVIDKNGDFIGFVSEKNFLTLVGDKERWQGSIQDLITRSVVTYSPETPMKIIFNFLSRVSMRRVIILQGKKPVGFIGRNMMLRWLRNRWATMSQDFVQIVPHDGTVTKTRDEMVAQFDYLLKQLDILNGTFDETSDRETQSVNGILENNKFALTVSLISQIQEILEQILIINANVANVQTSQSTSLSDTALYNRGLL